MRVKILLLVVLVVATSAFAAGWKWKAGKPTGHATVALAKGHQYTPSGWSWGEDAL